MGENKKITMPVVIATVMLLCASGICIWLGIRYFNAKSEAENMSTYDSIVTCSQKVFVIEKDNKNKVPEIPMGPGWEGGSAGINFYLESDNSLVYESWMDACEKYEEGLPEDEMPECLVSKKLTTRKVNTGYQCEYLFENYDTLTTNIEDPIAYGICYSNGKYYEIGAHEKTCGSNIEADSCKPYIEEITSQCTMN